VSVNLAQRIFYYRLGQRYFTWKDSIMIRPLIFAVIVVLAGMMAGNAHAVNCVASAGYTRINGLGTFMAGKTACKRNAGNTDWEWQEYHDPSGDLIDWKKGPSDSVDPSTSVGNWFGGTLVNYDYDAGAYSYRVWQRADNTYDFCNGSTLTLAAVTLKTGQVSCSAP
jgi:hypothetical protein